MQSELEEVIKAISRKYELPYKVVEKVVCSQYKFLRRMMGEGSRTDETTFQSLFLSNFGSFIPMRKRIKNNAAKKKLRETNPNKAVDI